MWLYYHVCYSAVISRYLLFTCIHRTFQNQQERNQTFCIQASEQNTNPMIYRFLQLLHFLSHPWLLLWNVLLQNKLRSRRRIHVWAEASGHKLTANITLDVTGRGSPVHTALKLQGEAESNISPSPSVIYFINPNSFLTSGETRRIFSEINVSTGGQHQAEGAAEMQREVN